MLQVVCRSQFLPCLHLTVMPAFPASLPSGAAGQEGQCVFWNTSVLAWSSEGCQRLAERWEDPTLVREQVAVRHEMPDPQT